MKRTILICVVLSSILIGVGRASGGGITYTDGFEAPTLNPFWSTYSQSGSIALSTAQAHSGEQSVQFTSSAGSENKSIELSHTFSTPIYGVTSVWVLDTGAGAASSNYISFLISNSNLNFTAVIGTYDYGFAGGGPGRGDQYDFSDSPFAGATATGIERSLAWHQFSFVDTPQSLSIMVDGVTVYTRAGAGGTPLDQVVLEMSGPSWRPGWVSYFDDFSFSQASVPEPSTLTLAGVSICVLLASAWHRRRRPVVR
jgi:hypothetical protein